LYAIAIIKTLLPDYAIIIELLVDYFHAIDYFIIIVAIGQ
jgi:hypothetical protein